MIRAYVHRSVNISFNFQGGKSCPQSIPTKTIVEACPVDSTEWIKAKEKKQCHLTIHNCTDKDKFHYHCLPNKFLDVQVEVCAPTTVIVGKGNMKVKCLLKCHGKYKCS